MDDEELEKHLESVRFDREPTAAERAQAKREAEEADREDE